MRRPKQSVWIVEVALYSVMGCLAGYPYLPCLQPQWLLGPCIICLRLSLIDTMQLTLTHTNARCGQKLVNPCLRPGDLGGDIPFPPSPSSMTTHWGLAAALEEKSIVGFGSLVLIRPWNGVKYSNLNCVQTCLCCIQCNLKYPNFYYHNTLIAHTLHLSTCISAFTTLISSFDYPNSQLFEHFCLVPAIYINSQNFCSKIFGCH